MGIKQNGRRNESSISRSTHLGFETFSYNASGFNKYGLMHDDVLYETPDVEEALRRLPVQLVDDRNFRITRALQASGQKKILPKEDWTKYEEDVRYLKPYLEEVIRERQEKEAWDRK